MRKLHWVCQWLCCIIWLPPPSFPSSIRKGSACCQCLVTWNLKINLTLKLNKAALTNTGMRLMARSFSRVSMCVFVNWAGQEVEQCCCGACLVYFSTACPFWNTARQGQQPEWDQIDSTTFLLIAGNLDGQATVRQEMQRDLRPSWSGPQNSQTKIKHSLPISLSVYSTHSS